MQRPITPPNNDAYFTNTTRNFEMTDARWNTDRQVALDRRAALKYPVIEGLALGRSAFDFRAIFLRASRFG